MLLSDSLPLFALPMKAVYKVTGWMPDYVGSWVALCLVLQAVCSSRLLFALEIRDALTHIAGLILFCFMPVLLLRFGHATLMGHFLILVALERYVVAKRHGLSKRGWLALD
ncbi:MAG: DUF6311 domain-containing protein [Pseudomonadota bacterium]|nr:DUF6311 domain-containing protein [Pseudomonadota bacterium]